MNGSFPATIADIIHAVERLLVENGPMTEEQLLSALRDSGVDLGREPADTLADLLESGEIPMVLPLPDGRQVMLPVLLADRVFTHRLEASEIEHDLLAIDSDLEPLSALTEDERYEFLVGGEPLIDVDVLFDTDLFAERDIPIDIVLEAGAFLLPPGHLREAGFSPGDLIGLRVTANGFQIEAIDERTIGTDPPAGLGQRLHTVLAAIPEAGGPEDLDGTVWTACADDPELFRTPLPPLGWILDSFGIPHQDGQIAAAGFDFDTWRVQATISSLRLLYGLDDDEALAVVALLYLYGQVAAMHEAAATGHVAHESVEQDLTQGSLAMTTLAFLADPNVAEAVLGETAGEDRNGAAKLAQFAETLEDLAPALARPALRWLHGKAFERLGDALKAEAVFIAAHAVDPDWPPLLYELARYASDRGDAAEGLALLRQARAPREDSLVALLKRFEPKPRPGLGRNKPCWCGSGRKYKVCHLNSEQLPLAERSAWLYQKALLHLLDGPSRAMVVDVAEVRAQYWDFPDALLIAFQDPLVTDSVLFHGGAFAEFLAERGALLPADERLLAEQWLLVERSVYEIEAVRPGRGISVRDLRTGERHDVQEKIASRELKEGMLICARIMPAGHTTQAFGGVEIIDLRERDALIDLLDTAPGPERLVGFLSRRFAPPRLQNTEGDPLVMCQATLEVPDPPALARALDETYDLSDPDTDDATENDPAGLPARWHEFVTTHGMQRIRATLLLSDDRLIIDTNSEARLERVLDTVRQLQPSITVVDESRQTAHEISEAMSRSETQTPEIGHGNALLNSADVDPEIAAMLEQMMHQYEQAWLDDSIPALAGHTPRQAAADPTRRPDLIRLLDSFPPDSGNPGAMNPDRLRSALGLQ
jgi:tetratricopeptide (TPR) repeat protein